MNEHSSFFQEPKHSRRDVARDSRNLEGVSPGAGVTSFIYFWAPAGHGMRWNRLSEQRLSSHSPHFPFPSAAAFTPAICTRSPAGRSSSSSTRTTAAPSPACRGASTSRSSSSCPRKRPQQPFKVRSKFNGPSRLVPVPGLINRSHAIGQMLRLPLFPTSQGKLSGGGSNRKPMHRDLNF